MNRYNGTNWDFTELAVAYLKRLNYSGDAIDAMLQVRGVETVRSICEVVAGVAHLGLELAE